MTRTTSLRVAVLQNECETGLGAFAGPLREAGVHYERYETHDKAVLPDPDEIDGVIVLGGSMAADDPALLGTRRWIRNAVVRDVPFLGVCLGGQLLATALGGIVGPASPPEVGVHDVYLTSGGRRDPLFGDLPGRFRVFGWHEDAFEPPRAAVPLAGSIACEHQAFRFGTNAYGIQFHPEVRPADLEQWASVPGYADLVERSGARWQDMAAELASASSDLDALARRLLEGWMALASSAAALDGRRRRIAA
jgi:GMP synthase-like glutamine amidotransferase